MSKNKNADKGKRSDSSGNLLPVMIVVIAALVLYFSKDSVIAVTGGSGAGRQNVPVSVPAAMQPPRQEDLNISGTVSLNGYTLQKVAAYSVAARVLGKKKYSGDRESDLARYDLVLGWGMMADKRILEDIDIFQTQRFYQWSTNDWPLPREQIETSSANVHIIPANSAIEATVSGLRKNDIVTLKGFLVSVTGPDGWSWRSSLSREDTGKGACELLYVESAIVH